jgi:hypothetical protein
MAPRCFWTDPPVSMGSENTSNRVQTPTKPESRNGGDSDCWCSIDFGARRHIARSEGKSGAAIENCEVRCLHSAGGHNSRGIEQSTAHAQKADLQRHCRLQLRPAPLGVVEYEFVCLGSSKGVRSFQVSECARLRAHIRTATEACGSAGHANEWSRERLMLVKIKRFSGHNEVPAAVETKA